MLSQRQQLYYCGTVWRLNFAKKTGGVVEDLRPVKKLTTSGVRTGKPVNGRLIDFMTTEGIPHICTQSNFQSCVLPATPLWASTVLTTR